MREDILPILSRLDLMDYISVADRQIRSFTEDDDPKSVEELQNSTRKELEDYLKMRVAYLQLLIDGETIH